MDFADAVQGAWVQDGPGVRTLGDPLEAWAQGRALFGGVAAGAVMGAARSAQGGTRRPRAVQASFVAPFSAGAKAKATVLREGRAVTQVAVALVQDDQTRVNATVTFGDGRPSGAQLATDVVDERQGPDGLRPFPYIEGVMPRFTQFFEFRWARGAIPFSGSSQAAQAGWCRHRTAPGPAHEAVLGLVDAWPCPALALLDRPAPGSSMNWTTTFIDVPAQVSAGEWFWYESACDHVADGYATMAGTLRTQQGVLVARFEQLVAIFG